MKLFNFYQIFMSKYDDTNKDKTRLITCGTVRGSSRIIKKHAVRMFELLKESHIKNEWKVITCQEEFVRLKKENETVNISVIKCNLYL